MATRYKTAIPGIKKVLKEKGVTQYRLAKMLKVTPDYITRMVNSKNPTLKTFNKVAKVLGCRVSDLIED